MREKACKKRDQEKNWTFSTPPPSPAPRERKQPSQGQVHRRRSLQFRKQFVQRGTSYMTISTQLIFCPKLHAQLRRLFSKGQVFKADPVAFPLGANDRTQSKRHAHTCGCTRVNAQTHAKQSRKNYAQTTCQNSNTSGTVQAEGTAAPVGGGAPTADMDAGAVATSSFRFTTIFLSPPPPPPPAPTPTSSKMSVQNQLPSPSGIHLRQVLPSVDDREEPLASHSALHATPSVSPCLVSIW